RGRAARAQRIALAKDLVPITGIRSACRVLTVSRATCYRALTAKPIKTKMLRISTGRQLSQAERDNILVILSSPEFVDKAPTEVYATLLDQGIFLCSISSMYRILRANGA